MTDWAKLKVVELKAELKRRDLPQHGLKAELVSRLNEADEATELGKEQQLSSITTSNELSIDPPAQSAADETAAEPTDSLAAPPGATAETTDDIVTAPVPDEKVDLSDQKPGETALEAPANDVEATETTSFNVIEPEPPTAPDAGAAQAQDNDKPIESHDTPIAKPTSEPEPMAQDTEEAVVSKSDEAKDLSTSEMPSREATSDIQKRKRRSASPVQSDDTIAKRLRVDMDATENEEATPVVAVPEAAVDAMDVEVTYDSDIEHNAATSVHPVTSALYISNLMRPMRPTDMQAHLVDLATRRGASLSNDIIVAFHLDHIRTHAFVVFKSKTAANRVRTLLHNKVWPDESNRKALFVDFVPPDKVDGWIDEEMAKPNDRVTRWEVSYTEGPGGTEARLQPAAAGPSRAPPPAPTGPSNGRRPPPPVAPGGPNSIPVGPRSFLREPPTGPRPKRSGPGPRPPPDALGDESSTGKFTRAYPEIRYQAVSEDLAHQRISNMRTFYKPNLTRREMGREYNRYSFENNDNFVDRGKEIFEGIRPPHRERAMRGGRGGGGGRGRRGGPPPGPPMGPRRGDRYVPGGDRGGDGGRRGYGGGGGFHGRR